MNKSEKTYNLEERTAQFGESTVDLCKSIKPSIIATPIIKQLVRSATSIGANYLDANGASSRKDFRNKIFICKKEVQETKHWLRMLKRVLPETENDIRKLWQEAHELSLIFGKISAALNKN